MSLLFHTRVDIRSTVHNNNNNNNNSTTMYDLKQKKKKKRVNFPGVGHKFHGGRPRGVVGRRERVNTDKSSNRPA